VQTTGSLPNFTPRAANIGLSYIRDRVNLRVAFGRAGKTLTTFNAQPHLRVYRLASNRLDLKVKFSLSKNYEIYFDVYNFTNDKLRLIWGDRKDRPRQILDRNDPQLHFGINGRF
jgi:hypothetical protein